MHSMNSKLPEDEHFGGIEKNSCEDKISSLHEDLLIHILGFLPMRDVVATMFLSKRWRSIWKMVPKLEYEERKDNTNNEGGSILWFLNKSLQEHRAPILESLYIELEKSCPIDDNVSKWIAKAVDRQVRRLIFTLMCSAEPIALPTRLYTCETLVALKLKRQILIDVPSSICLTSLKKLFLIGVVYKDEVSANRLLSSCPVLEELFVARHRNRNDNMTNFMVEVSSLKILYYYDSRLFLASVPSATLVIDCPELISLSIYDHTRVSWSSKNMSYLDKLGVATFMDPIPGEEIWLPFIDIKLATTRVMGNGCGDGYFARLRYLTLNRFCTLWMGPLLFMLDNSPILKHLEINSSTLKKITSTWNQPNSVPKCVSSNLEVFKWSEYGGRTEEKNLATYILGNSTRLKYAEFVIFHNDLEIRNLMRDELYSMFRVSSSNLKVFNFDN